MSFILACKPWQACKLVDNLQQIVPTQLSCWRIVCKLATSCEILMYVRWNTSIRNIDIWQTLLMIQEQKMLLDFPSKNIIKQICFWLYSSGYRWCNVKLQKDSKLSKNIVRQLFCRIQQLRNMTKSCRTSQQNYSNRNAACCGNKFIKQEIQRDVNTRLLFQHIS